MADKQFEATQSHLEKARREGDVARSQDLSSLGAFAAGAAAVAAIAMPLGSTLPPISPVAWSTFQTGTNPGKHNIFDFLVPSEQTYQPKLSSVEVHPPRRALQLGKYRIPLGKRNKAAPPFAVSEACTEGCK